jgi:hypothetical protein
MHASETEHLLESFDYIDEKKYRKI